MAGGPERPTQGLTGSPLAFHAAGLFVAAVSQYLLLFVANGLLSRALGAEGRGIYYAPVLGALTLLTLCKLGLDQANVFLLGSRSISVSRLVGQNGFIALWAGLVGCAGTVALHWVVPSVFGETPLSFLLLAGLTIPFGIHSLLSGGILSLIGRSAWQYRAGLSSAAAQVVLLGVLIVVGQPRPGTVLVITLIAAIVNWAVMNWPLASISSQWYTSDIPLLKETLRSSLVLHVAALLLFLHLRLDLFMVKAWLGTRALGYYSLTVTLADTLPLATEAIALAVLPGQVVNTLSESAARALRAARATFAVGTLVALGWLIVGVPVIRVVFGAEFLPAFFPLVVLLPGMILMGMQRTCAPPALRAGRPVVMVLIFAASLACNVLLNFLWIPRWGLVGASAASTVSYAMSTMMFLVWTSRLVGAPVMRALIPTRDDWYVLVRAARYFAKTIMNGAHR